MSPPVYHLGGGAKISEYMHGDVDSGCVSFTDGVCDGDSGRWAKEPSETVTGEAHTEALQPLLQGVIQDSDAHTQPHRAPGLEGEGGCHGFIVITSWTGTEGGEISTHTLANRIPHELQKPHP